MRWLAFVHPAIMSAVLALGGIVLRQGLLSRRARLSGIPFDTRLHRRLARIFLALVALGIVSGPLSLGPLRGKLLAESVHFYLLCPAVFALGITGILGYRMEHGRGLGARELHALLGALGLLLALTAGLAAFAILP